MINKSLDDIQIKIEDISIEKSVQKLENPCNARFYKNVDACDWLKNIPLPEGHSPFRYVEVRFKNDHRDFFSYSPDLELMEGDIVAVEADQGHDVGTVVLVGEIVRFQMERKGVSSLAEIKKVYRKVRMQDIERWIQAIEREHKTLIEARQIIDDLKLEMKLNDLEFRGDGTKAIFYYTANDRIDFRELIKILAERFRIKVEMRQIGVRQEAAKVGGIGSCGRELCCCTWIPSFQSVSTQSARTQQLPLNPQKLAGQCGKLKCCLNYEQDIYVDTLRYFPSPNVRLKTKEGNAVFVKSDVLKKILFYAYEKEDRLQHLIGISVNDAWKVIKMNEKNQFPPKLEDFVSGEDNTEEKIGFERVDQDDINRFDKPHQRNRHQEKSNRGRDRKRNQSNNKNK